MRHLNFLFVATKVPGIKPQHPFPYGMAYVTAFMRSRGFNVFCLDVNFREEPVEIQLREEITSHEIDVVCTGGMSVEFNAISEVLDTAKRIKPELITVVGGAIITSDPKLAIESMQIDYGVLKEGEYTMAELAEALCNKGDPSVVTGLVFKDSHGKFVSTGERKAIRNLDDLPMPDYEGFEFERHLTRMKPNGSDFPMMDEVRQANIITSRSCPFSCTFCYHPLGRVYRQQSMDNVFKEIDFLRGKYGINCISVMDELFSVKKERMMEFAARIAPYKILWTAQLRVPDVNPELLRTLKASGLAWISYGIESVNDTILKSMKKKITAKQIYHALKITREAKIGITGNILLGDPEETEGTFESSLKWWKKHPEYDLNLCLIKAVPDALVYRMALERGLIKDKIGFMRNNFPVINLTKMTDLKFNMLVSKVNRYQADGRFKVRGKVLSSRKTHVDEEGNNCFTFTAQCPECGKTSVYANFHQISPEKYFSIFCRQCLRRHYISTLITFSDNYTFMEKMKFTMADSFLRLYRHFSFVRYYIEKIPFVAKAIVQFRSKFRRVAFGDVQVHAHDGSPVCRS